MSLSVSIVIVSYNSAATIGPCLESVLATMRPGDDAIVVDNCSRDNTREIVASLRSSPRGERIRLIANPSNNGFSAATNQGIRAGGAPLIVILNPDTIVTTGWLERLAAHLNDGVTAAVGPVSNFAAGQQSVAAHWRGDLPLAIGPEAAADTLYAMNRGRGLVTSLLIGFCLMLRRDVVMRLGGLDERLFLGNDDLELSWRVRQHGHALKIATDVFVYHEGQHSFRTEPGEVTSRLVQESTAALYRILEEHYGPGRVPPPGELWGIDWFTPHRAQFNPSVRFDQLLTLPHARITLTHPLVSIVILTHNQRAYTEECLAALERHTPEPYEVILVDNASTDGTAGWLAELAAADDRYRLICNPTNRGFAVGCNQGLAAARGEYLVLLNNDVIVTPDWLGGLLECHQRNPLAGIVGPFTNNASGIQGLGAAAYDSEGGLDRFATIFRTRNRFRRITSRRLVGFCMLFHRRLYLEIGGLDERFGTGNFEDDDLCLRAAIAGHVNLVAGDVYVHHHGSITFAGAGIDYHASMSGNRRLFQDKWSQPVSDQGQGMRIDACRLREETERQLHAERFQEASSLAGEAHRLYPDDRALQALLSRAMWEAGQWSPTAPCADVSTPFQAMYQARSLMERGGYDDADAILRAAVAHAPSEGELYLMRGELARLKGEQEFASELVLKGFRLSPTASAAVCALAGLCDSVCPSRLLPLVDEAAGVNPESRMLARLRVEMAARCAGAGEVLTAAEQYVERFGCDDRVLEAGIKARRALGAWLAPAAPGKAISLCMIARDEERHIARCLASCRPLVHEMIVVDTGSVDRTPLLAELLGARVLHHPWGSNFSEARNVSLDAAGGDWIMVMDGDETLSTRDYAGFREAVESFSSSDAYSMSTRNYTTSSALEGFNPLDGAYPEEEAGSGWTSSEKVRIFPNRRDIRFKGVVHELVETGIERAGLRVIKHPVPVHHYGNLEKMRQERKQLMYYTLGLQKLNRHGRTPKALYELAVQAAELGRFEEAGALWRELLAAEPELAVGWFNLGYVYLRMGTIDLAQDASMRAIALRPGYQAALANLALCRFCLLEPPRALEELREISRQCAEPAVQVLLHVAWCLCNRLDIGFPGLTMLAAHGRDFTGLLGSTAGLLRGVGRGQEAVVVEALATAIAPGGSC